MAIDPYGNYIRKSRSKNSPRPSAPPPPGRPKQKTKTVEERIEFKFAFANEEDHTVFTLRNGYEITKLNENIEADFDDNVLKISVKTRRHVQATISAITDNLLVLDIAGVYFNLKPETIQYSIEQARSDTDLILDVNVEIDPLSAKIPGSSDVP